MSHEQTNTSVFSSHSQTKANKKFIMKDFRLAREWKADLKFPQLTTGTNLYR